MDKPRTLLEELESELRIQIWNNCKLRNLRDDAAYEVIEKRIADVKSRSTPQGHC